MIISALLIHWGYQSEVKLLTLSAVFLLSIILQFLFKNSVIVPLIIVIISFPLNITFLLPFLKESAYVSGIYINYLAPFITILDIALMQLALSLVSFKKSNRIFFSKVPIWCIASFYIYFIIQSLIHFDPNVAIHTIRLLLYSSTFILVISRWELIYSTIKKYQKIILLVVLISVLFQVIIGSLQVKNGNSVGLDFLGESKLLAGYVDAATVVVNSDLILRAYGTFPHPNMLAGFLAGLFILILHIDKNFKVNRYLSILIIIICMIGILLTLSQSGMFALLISSGGFILLTRTKISNLLKTKLNSIFFLIIPEKESFIERLSLMRSSFDYLLAFPLFGVGNGNFTRYFYEFAPFDSGGLTLIQPVHNIFILFLVENGVLGSFILVLIIFLLIKRVKINISSLSIISLAVIFIIGSLDHYLATLPQGLFLLFLFILPFFIKTNNELKMVK